MLNSVRNLTAHRDLALLGMAVIPLGPNSLRISEAMLAILDESGISRRARVWAVDLIALYIVATAAEAATREKRLQESRPELERSQDIIGSIAPQTFPHLHDLRPEFAALAADTETRQRWMAEALVNGILSTSASAG